MESDIQTGFINRLDITHLLKLKRNKVLIMKLKLVNMGMQRLPKQTDKYDLLNILNDNDVLSKFLRIIEFD